MPHDFFAIGAKYRSKQTGEIYTLKDSELRVLIEGAWVEDYILFRDERYFFFAEPKEQFLQEFEYVGYR